MIQGCSLAFPLHKITPVSKPVSFLFILAVHKVQFSYPKKSIALSSQFRGSPIGGFFY